MSASSMRLVAAAIALGLTGAFTVLPAAAATAPPPGSEGPAGPSALMPNGKVAAPPRVTAPQVSTSCPAAPYGAQRSAPGSGKTVALTFDDGPGGASHLIPYQGTNPVERLIARVTLAFFDRYVLGQADALKTMTRDGNITGTATLVSDGQTPP